MSIFSTFLKTLIFKVFHINLYVFTLRFYNNCGFNTQKNKVQQYVKPQDTCTQ